MAKSGFYLYGVRGKVGNLVARKGEDGKTILAAYQDKVKNPQTNLQMAQRIILATVAQAAPQLSPIIDHSFEGVAIGTKCIREFRRLNMGLLRQYAAQDFNDAPKPADATCFMTTKGVKALIPNKYQISSGTLSSTRLKIERFTQGDGRYLLVTPPDLNIPLRADEVGQYVALKDVMLQMFGISGVNEQLTFVAIQRSGEGYKFVFQNNDSMPGWVIPYTSMRAARLVLSADVDLNVKYYVPAQNPDASAVWSSICDGILYAFQQSPRTDSTLWGVLANFLNALDTEDDFDGGALSIHFEHGFDIDSWTVDPISNLGHAYAVGIIRSKLDTNGKWQYSNTFMQTCALATDEYNYGLEWNSAIQAWFQTNEVAANELYLKEGTDTNNLGESLNEIVVPPIVDVAATPSFPWAAGTGGSLYLMQPITEEELLAQKLVFEVQGGAQTRVTFDGDVYSLTVNGDIEYTIDFVNPTHLTVTPTGDSIVITSVTRV